MKQTGTDMTDEYFDEFSTRVFYNIILLQIDGLELENKHSNYIKNCFYTSGNQNVQKLWNFMTLQKD